MISERVQHMLENEGVYLLSHIAQSEEVVVVASIGGKLIAMEKGHELAPNGFNPGMIIKHGPLR